MHLQARGFRAFLASSAALAVLVLAGCGGGAAKQSATTTTPTPPPAAPAGPKVVRIALDADPPHLDPSKSSAYVDRIVHASLYDKLVDIDKDLKIVPQLAESWNIENDGKTYTFHLRKNVLFHDGTPFNAEAVKFNWDRDMAKDSPRRSELSSIDKITVVDESTIKVDLKAAFAPFLSVLADRAGMIVSPTAVQKEGQDYEQHPVGTGPFMFKERVKGDHIELVKNPKYWMAGFPKLDGVIFKAVTDENARVLQVKSGALDMADRPAAKQIDSLAADKSVVLDGVVSLGYQGIYLNTTKPPFDNKALRQAFSWAIDREALVKVVWGTTAVPADGPFPPGTPANDNAPIPPRDVEKAKQILGGKTYNVQLMVTAGSPTARQVGEVIQNMEKEAGINVELQQVEFGKILDAQDKFEYQASQVGWSGRPDPDGNFYAFYYTKGGFNNSGYSNPRVDQLLDQSRIPPDMTQRKPLLLDALKTIREDAPYVYLWFPKDYKLYAPYVKGYVHVPDGIIRTVDMDIQK